MNKNCVYCNLCCCCKAPIQGELFRFAQDGWRNRYICISCCEVSKTEGEIDD